VCFIFGILYSIATALSTKTSIFYVSFALQAAKAVPQYFLCFNDIKV
jgi:hypothetical protein